MACRSDQVNRIGGGACGNCLWNHHNPSCQHCEFIFVFLNSVLT
jgi:transposase-like protein